MKGKKKKKTPIVMQMIVVIIKLLIYTWTVKASCICIKSSSRAGLL